MNPQLIRRAARVIGFPRVVRGLTRSGVRILMYHRFRGDMAGLRAECEHIRRYYRPVTLQAVAQSYRGGPPLPANAVAITVDDGYRDYLLGHPVFRAFDIPTTMFLVTDFVDGRLWLWTDVLKHAFTSTPLTAVDLTGIGETPISLRFTTQEQRLAAAQDVAARLKQIDNDARLGALNALRTALQVDLPAAPPPENAPLSWDEVRTLAGDGVEFGAHTKTHPVLSRVSDRRALEEEIVAPKARIEAETGRPVTHFCYPNGRTEDFTEDAVAAVQRAGFLTAVTTERGLNFSRTNPLLLRRIGVEPSNPLPYFEDLLAGVRAS